MLAVFVVINDPVLIDLQHRRAFDPIFGERRRGFAVRANRFITRGNAQMFFRRRQLKQKAAQFS